MRLQDSETLHKVSLKVKPFTLDNEFLHSLCNIIEQEREKIEGSSITYEINGEAESFETTSVKEFLAYDIPHDWNTIGLRLYSTSKRIRIHISKPYDSSIDIESSDYDWIYGKKEQLKKILKRKELPLNKFFKSRSSWFLFVPLGILLSILQYSPNLTVQNAWMFAITLFTYPICLYFLFYFMFSNVETKHTKFKKIIGSLPGKVSIIASIITILSFIILGFNK